jgi:glycosyltransferase involved in cell wall biosynthesis
VESDAKGKKLRVNLFLRILDGMLDENLKIALIHDWLVSMRGGEKVLEVFCQLFPLAPLYTLVHRPGSVSSIIEQRTIHTSMIQKFPLGTKYYQRYLPLFPTAIERFDVSGYDVILSTSHAVAKGARSSSRSLHICYCFTPMRYIWDQYEQYFGNGRASFLTRTAMRLSLGYLRSWDVQSSDRVNYFIADSRTVQERIKRIYKRDSDLIYPPVDVERFSVTGTDDGFYLIVSALVPYKRIDLAIEAFNRNGERLVIIGTGNEEQRLKLAAKKNIEFLGWQSDEEVKKYYERCRALIFPGEEDFGIVPVEAMACGKPVIAYASGGVTETVVDRKTGVYFHERTPDDLNSAIKTLHQLQLDPETIRTHALQFGRENFVRSIKKYIEEKVSAYDGCRHVVSPGFSKS